MKKFILFLMIFLSCSAYNYASEWILTQEKYTCDNFLNTIAPSDNVILGWDFIKYQSKDDILVFLYGRNGDVIYKSSDTGRSWHYFLGDTSLISYAATRAFLSNIQYIKESNSIIISWMERSYGNKINFRGFILLNEENDSITVITSDVPTSSFSAYFNGLKNCIIYGEDANLYFSDDSLKTFREISTLVGKKVWGINFSSDNTISYWDFGNSLYRSIDTGQSWELVENWTHEDSIMVFRIKDTLDYPDGYDKIPISENESITVCGGNLLLRAVRVVGISEPTIYTNILLSPNPANSTATLSLDLEKAGDLQITLTNITGQEVLQLHNSFVDIGAFTKVFSVADLPSGTYFVRIQLGNNTKYEKLIVK